MISGRVWLARVRRLVWVLELVDVHCFEALAVSPSVDHLSKGEAHHDSTVRLGLSPLSGEPARRLRSVAGKNQLFP